MMRTKRRSKKAEKRIKVEKKVSRQEAGALLRWRAASFYFHSPSAIEFANHGKSSFLFIAEYNQLRARAFETLLT